MKKIIRFLFSLLFIYSAALSLYSQDAESLMSNLHIMGSSSRLNVRFTMEIQTGRGNKTRELELFMEREPEKLKLLVQVLSPSFLSRMKYLLRREGNRENRWLNTSRGVRQLSSANNSEPLFNSDFTVEDISLFSTGNYILELLPETRESRVIRAAPLQESSTYAWKEFSISRNDNLLTRIDYFDNSGTLIKQYMVQETRIHEGILFPARAIMRNIDKGTETLLLVDRIELPSSIPSRRFNRGNL